MGVGTGPCQGEGCSTDGSSLKHSPPTQLDAHVCVDCCAQVPVTMLPSAVAERCHEASHSHAPSYHFPMGTTKTDLKKVMSTATADAEVSHEGDGCVGR